MKKILLIIPFFLFSCCFAMEQQERCSLQKTPSKPKTLLSEQFKIVNSLINLINKLKDGDNLEINSFVLTNKNLTDSLIQAKERGVKLRIIVDKQSFAIDPRLLFRLAEQNIPVFVFKGENINHLKAVIWSYKNDEGQQLYRVAQGSSNLTHLAESNWEHLTIIPNDKEMYDYFHEINNNLIKQSNLIVGTQVVSPGKRKAEKESDYAPAVAQGYGGQAEATTDREQPKLLKKQKIILEASPKKATAIGYFTHNLSDTLKEFIKRSAKGTSIEISTYTYNDFAFTKTLIEALKKGVKIKLIIDGVNLHHSYPKIQNFISSQLNALNKAGAEIYVYNPMQKKLAYDKYPIKAHRKVITLDRPDGKKIVIEGSGNFTYQEDVNAFVIHPDNLEMFNTFKKANERLIDDSLPYEALFLMPTKLE